MGSKNIAELLLEKDFLKLNFKNPFQFVSGILSPLYEDERLLISYPSERNLIVDAMVQKIKDLKIDYIAGVATAGIPWASWLSHKLDKPMLYVRPTPREIGTKKQVEGSLKKGDKVVIVEPVVSTGGSLLEVVEAVERAGGKVEDVLVLYTHEFEDTFEKLKHKNLKVHNLTEFSTVVDAAHNMGKISKKEKDQIIEWKNNPDEWSKRFREENTL